MGSRQQKANTLISLSKYAGEQSNNADVFSHVNSKSIFLEQRWDLVSIMQYVFSLFNHYGFESLVQGTQKNDIEIDASSLIFVPVLLLNENEREADLIVG